MRIWSEVRTQQQIADNRYGPIPSPQTNLSGYWPVDAANPGVLLDLSGNGRDVTMMSTTGNSSDHVMGGNVFGYGFNGQEKSTEINNNSYTAEFWQYDARIGRRFNLDPKPNISISPYSSFEGNPIMYSDVLGDSIAPGRTKGMNFIVVATKADRDADIKKHGFFSPLKWDYIKAKKMERKSGGGLKVIETDCAQDAVDQIKGSLKPDEYVKNITIDFHRSSGNFDDAQFNDETNKSSYSIKTAFNDLANGYIGKGSNVYLGQCWAGGNEKLRIDNLSQRASEWLDGATTYGHQAAASSLSFFFNNHFSGAVYRTDYGKTEANLARKGYHTISYFQPKLGYVVSVELKARVYIRNIGEIHLKSNVNLNSLKPIIPYGVIPLIKFTPPSIITPPGN